MIQEPESRAVAARGDATRKRLIAAGLQLFATLGYHAVSTRDIARMAQVNHAAIGFHFKGKQGLYGAVISVMVEKLQEICVPLVATIDRNVASCAGDRLRLRALVREAVGQFLTASIRTERSRWLGVLLQREYVDPTPAFDTIYKEVVEPVLGAIERLVQAASGLDVTQQRNRIRVYCIILQLTNLGQDRAILQRRFGSELYEPALSASLVDVVTDGVCGILGI
ncbi:CerR family C-terminal domain-containing protein [Solidesulfovibrio sp. C21]|uniref:CerR family C-terminal domain-containing protein n=1 Tax=Solidesulfovibrio sp. C21 TaxID=3398613 RepID=UPI0039FC3004